MHVRLSLSEITSLFGLSRYLDRTFAQRMGSAKVKSPVVLKCLVLICRVSFVDICEKLNCDNYHMKNFMIVACLVLWLSVDFVVV